MIDILDLQWKLTLQSVGDEMKLQTAVTEHLMIVEAKVMVKSDEKRRREAEQQIQVQSPPLDEEDGLERHL
jgi:hypothetical protein